MILGIDEAGRGPVMGPLVLCGVRGAEGALDALAALGLRDSKAYGSGVDARDRRRQLALAIRSTDGIAVHVEVATPDHVDRWVAEGGLNRLEQELARAIIRAGPLPRRIIADGARLFAPLRDEYPMLLAVDRADATETVVAAASIVAKDVRDRAMEALLAPHERQYGPIRGGGYPNRATADFLRKFCRDQRRLPAGVRHSWGWPVLAELAREIQARKVAADEP